MAKPLLRIKARELRQKGESVKVIAKLLGVSKGTISVWVRDIILTVEQLEKLKKRSIEGAELGRLKGALVQKERRIRLIEESKKYGVRTILNSLLAKREFLIAGLALYWGEGDKKSKDLKFCNSDPKVIKFLIEWLRVCFGIPLDRLKCSVGINQIHHSRERGVKEYWFRVLGIPLEQFNKTSFKKAKNKKVYENFNNHYGTLTVRVTKPGSLLYKILGMIEGLYQAGSGLVSRGVS